MPSPNPTFPLESSARKNLIKLYCNDVGILTSILFHENIQTILNMDNALNLGSVYETSVAMELIAHGHRLYYYDRKKVGEVDFLINDYDKQTVLPIEVKSGRQGYDFRALPRLVNPKRFLLPSAGLSFQQSKRDQDGKQHHDIPYLYVDVSLDFHLFAFLRKKGHTNLIKSHLTLKSLPNAE